METKEVKVQCQDGTLAKCLMRVAVKEPWQIELIGPGSRMFSASGKDLPGALKVLRREFEALGMRILVNGSRKDVVCSGMSRSMGGGRKACIVQIGHQASRDNLVDLLDPTEPELIASVESQEDYYDQWVNSLRER